jgi:hypothetical protein
MFPPLKDYCRESHPAVPYQDQRPHTISNMGPFHSGLTVGLSITSTSNGKLRFVAGGSSGTMLFNVDY